MEGNLSHQTSSLEIVCVTSSGSQCTLNTGGLMSKLCCLGQKSLVHFQCISAGISSLAPGRTGFGPEGRRRDRMRCHHRGINLFLSKPCGHSTGGRDSKGRKSRKGQTDIWSYLAILCLSSIYCLYNSSDQCPGQCQGLPVQGTE